MSGQGLTFTGAPQIEIGASTAKVGAASPGRNSAIELAGALNGLNTNLVRAAGAVATEDQQVQAAAAKKAALSTGGKQLADAVRDGTLSPTQNPFFIQDYNQESAYVRATSALQSLTVQSQQWAEKSDPIKFGQKYSEELAKIGKDYNDPDSQAGFNAAAAPAHQQALAANAAEAGAIIEKERLSNLSTIVTQNITAIQGIHAGNASPEQILSSLQDAHDHYIGTGGNEPAWQKILYNGFTSAAYNSQDPELLDKLPQAIKNQPGIADQIANDKYHIMQASGAKLRQQAQDVRDRITLEGQNIFTGAYKKYGLSLIQGSVSFAQLQADNPGVNPLSIAAALNTVQSATADNQSLAIAKTKSFENDPQGATYLLDLHTEANTLGISPELNAKVGALVHSRAISVQDGSQIINQAIDTTKALNQTPGAVFPTPGKGLKVAQGAVASAIKPYDDLRRATDAEATTMIEWVNKSARVNGNPIAGPNVVGYLKATMANAAAQWLATHPGDFPGARKRAQEANGQWFQDHAEEYTKPKGKAK